MSGKVSLRIAFFVRISDIVYFGFGDFIDVTLFVAVIVYGEDYESFGLQQV